MGSQGPSKRFRTFNPERSQSPEHLFRTVRERSGSFGIVRERAFGEPWQPAGCVWSINARITACTEVLRSPESSTVFQYIHIYTYINCAQAGIVCRNLERVGGGVAYIYIYVCYIYTYIYTYVCMYVCMYVSPPI